MPNRLELPDELNSLIEKREADRRAPVDEQVTDQTEPPQSPTGEERRQGDRRQS